MGDRLARIVSGLACAVVLAGCVSEARQKAEARFQQAEEWYSMSKYNEAGTLYKDALELTDGDYPEAALGYGCILRELCLMASKRFKDGKVENGIDVKQVEKYYKASERWLTHAQMIRPGYRDAHYALGQLYFETANSKTIPRFVCRTPMEVSEYKWVKLKAAQEQFEKAYQLEPSVGTPHEYLAQIFNLLGAECARRNDLSSASDFFEKSMASCDLFMSWVHVQMRQQQRSHVVDFYVNRILEFEMLKADLASALGDMSIRFADQKDKAGDAKGAIACYEKVVAYCDLYLAWLQRQTNPPDKPNYKTEQAKPIEERRSKALQALTALGKPPASALQPDANRKS
jgi:tetratricopeptide (TPR) repeat protein